MKNEQKKLYVSILLWIYEKGHVGFTKEEMKTSLTISDEEWPWVDWMVFNAASGAELLAWSIPDSSEYGIRFYPTSSGMAAAVDYLELKEAQNSSRRAEYIAFWSIGIAVVVGVVQIIIAIIGR